jgi:hypothetical protein
MTRERMTETDPRMKDAITELEALIRSRYPDATFSTSPGEDPEGIYVTATVDVADTDEVVDVFIDRLIDLQVEEGLPLYVIPVRPLARITEELNARAARPQRTVIIAPPLP